MIRKTEIYFHALFGMSRSPFYSLAEPTLSLRYRKKIIDEYNC